MSGIDHLALRVSDIERSARFYAEHLGATVRSRSSSSIFMDVGAQWIALFGPGAASTGFAPTPPGVDHVSFQPTAVRSFEERTKALRDHGLDPQSPPGSGRVYFKDPDGDDPAAELTATTSETHRSAAQSTKGVAGPRRAC